MSLRAARPPRHSARLRLALTYAMLVLASGAALLALMYVLFRVNLAIRPLDVSELDCAPIASPAAQATASAPPPATVACRAGATGAVIDASRTSGGDTPVQAVPAEMLVGGVVLDEAFRRLGPVAGASVLLLAFASLGLGWWMAGRALAPVRAITAAAHRLSDATLNERIRLRTRDEEFVVLAATFNAMIERLERAFEAQRTFVANASHELRTPLAIARAELDVTLGDPAATADDLRRMGNVVRETTERSDRAIEALLTLAIAGQPLRRAPVALDGVVHAVLDGSEPDRRARRLRLDIDVSPVEVVGDGALLERLIENVVRNAIVHNVDAGWIYVNLRESDDHAVFVVENSGSVVPRSEASRLFDRFHRAGDSPGHGLGLGLSIAAMIVAAHQGRIEATARPGGGLEMRVMLPVTNRPAHDTRTADAHESDAAGATAARG